MGLRCLDDVSRKWKRVKWWSPPMHYQMEVTASMCLPPIYKTKDIAFGHIGGDITPMSCSSCGTDDSTSSSLPQHNISAPSIPPSFFHRFKSRVKSTSLLDIVTNAAGSRFVFLLTLALLTLWVLLGIVLGTSEVWQIIMQNGSSIQCYVSDTLLMRQQQNTCCELLAAIGDLQSRNRSINRMLKSLSPSQRESLRSSLEKNPFGSSPSTISLPAPTPTNLFDKVCDYVASAVGSLPSILLYTAGIFIWLGLGKIYNFSNLWQLYINTAVAVSLTFTSMFLQNVRRRHSDSLSRALSNIKTLDKDLEIQLRDLTLSTEPHQSYLIPTPETSSTERIIDIYAYIVGSGIGVLLSAIVVTIWLALGHLLQWNSNWWLIIGTYTGLVGFIDGFVLRNVYFRQTQLLNNHLTSLSTSDTNIFLLLNLPSPKPSSSTLAIQSKEKSLSYKISNWTITICSLPPVVMISFGIVLVLIGIATGLKWSETGQLLCNTPTMILEGLLLLVLFQAHNLSFEKREGEFEGVGGRRGMLKMGLDGLSGEKGEGEGKEVDEEMEMEKEGGVSVSVVTLVGGEKDI